MNRVLRLLAVVLLAVGLISLCDLPALADNCGFKDTQCNTGGDGAYVGMTETQTQQLVAQQPPEAKRGKDKPVAYEFVTVADCGSNNPDSANIACPYAMTACNAVPDSRGPLVRLFRRIVYNRGKPGSWAEIGKSCYTELIPAESQQLTIEMIKDAWSHTPFAKPTVAIQPAGGVTLVHLKTFFAAEWPQEGFEPGEVNTVTLLGHSVQIKPTLEQYDYDLGDGRHIGPTTSPGGPWPDGDVNTAYEDPGRYPTNVTVTYGGEFSVDGSDWSDIPGTLDVAGPVQELTVRTAPSRLVSD